MMEVFDPDRIDLQHLMAQSGSCASTVSVYAIDRDWRLAYVDDGWRYFAIANGGGDTLVHWPRGRAIMDCVPASLNKHYAEMYKRAFAGEVVHHLYQCSSPSEYREDKMTLVATPDRSFVLAFQVNVVERSIPSALDLGYGSVIAMYADKRHRIIQCAHCRKVKRERRSDQWDFVPLLLRTNLFDVTDQLCPSCVRWHDAQRAKWAEAEV